MFQRYTEYFEKLATECLAIAHSEEKKRFVLIDIDEVINGLRTKIDFNNFCLLLEAYETSLPANTVDNIRQRCSGAFMVLKHVPAKGSDQERYDVLQEAEEIVFTLLSRLKKEASENLQQKTIPNWIDFNSININKVGPLWDSCYGWRVMFTFQPSANPALKYVQENWYQPPPPDPEP